MSEVSDKWNDSNPYEYFMGRWSRKLAPSFVKLLHIKSNDTVVDVGCGTGALSKSLVEVHPHIRLIGIEPSLQFKREAQQFLKTDGKILVGDASNIPLRDHSADLILSGLALNFFPDIHLAMSEMKRVCKTSGIISAYVWDYAEGMKMLRIFWDTAISLNPEAANLDEGSRFPICNPGSLLALFKSNGLTNIEVEYIDAYQNFKNFDDYWNPFLGGQGPAPAYVASLNNKERSALKTKLEYALPTNKDGTVTLISRAIAIKGINPK
jgi:SAM-dependent methyltransferase